jgi:hypothetical protein
MSSTAATEEQDMPYTQAEQDAAADATEAAYNDVERLEEELGEAAGADAVRLEAQLARAQDVYAALDDELQMIGSVRAAAALR